MPLHRVAILPRTPVAPRPLGAPASSPEGEPGFTVAGPHGPDRSDCSVPAQLIGPAPVPYGSAAGAPILGRRMNQNAAENSITTIMNTMFIVSKCDLSPPLCRALLPRGGGAFADRAAPWRASDFLRPRSSHREREPRHDAQRLSIGGVFASRPGSPSIAISACSRPIGSPQRSQHRGASAIVPPGSALPGPSLQDRSRSGRSRGASRRRQDTLVAHPPGEPLMAVAHRPALPWVNASGPAAGSPSPWRNAPTHGQRSLT
jgi:hypothetical protein